MYDVVIVIPCYNEKQRLDSDAFRGFMETDRRTAFVFVNDGSTDDTLSLLNHLQAMVPDRVSIVDIPENVGKAEAVRQGMLAAMERGARYAGYWDADLATPLGAIPTFSNVLDQHEEVAVVLGARVRLLGRTIERRAARHYLGRVFATAASFVLGLPVYDTQCGAKLLRVNRETTAAFFEPFRSRWIFDVELIGRLAPSKAAGAAIKRPKPNALYELPLLEWRDIPGSKLRVGDFINAARDLIGIFATRESRAAPAPEPVVVPVEPGHQADQMRQAAAQPTDMPPSANILA